MTYSSARSITMRRDATTSDTRQRRAETGYRRIIIKFSLASERARRRDEIARDEIIDSSAVNVASGKSRHCSAARCSVIGETRRIHCQNFVAGDAGGENTAGGGRNTALPWKEEKDKIYIRISLQKHAILITL